MEIKETEALVKGIKNNNNWGWLLKVQTQNIYLINIGFKTLC
jgi:hypothetical protein